MNPALVELATLADVRVLSPAWAAGLDKTSSYYYVKTMASWLKILKNDPAERPKAPPQVTLYATDKIVTVASTSANAVIRELTTAFARDMKEKADKLQVTQGSNE